MPIRIGIGTRNNSNNRGGKILSSVWTVNGRYVRVAITVMIIITITKIIIAGRRAMWIVNGVVHHHDKYGTTDVEHHCQILVTVISRIDWPKLRLMGRPTGVPLSLLPKYHRPERKCLLLWTSPEVVVVVVVIRMTFSRRSCRTWKKIYPSNQPLVTANDPLHHNDNTNQKAMPCANNEPYPRQSLRTLVPM